MPQIARLLIAEQDEKLAEEIARNLNGSEYNVRHVRSGEELFNALAQNACDVVLCNLNVPPTGGLDVLRFVRRLDSRPPVIVFSEDPSIRTAVEVVRQGALDFIESPINYDLLRSILAHAVQKKHQETEAGPDNAPIPKFDAGYIVGDSEPMQRVFKMIERVAPTDSTVLILGESGTGKELIAKAIHSNSHRSDQNLVTINCGAIPQELLESELFGFEKGAFTGAHRTRIGRFEMAHKGTIFLDEIGDMPLALQVKMLRVLQEKKFERIGASESVSVDVRIIAATHRDLNAAIREKTFREDLYYRLNVFPIVLPPLRRRKSDIPLLTEAILERFRRIRNHKISGVSEETMMAIVDYNWPGNVRELENVIERAIILKDEGLIELEDLPDNVCEAVVAEDRIQTDVSSDFRNFFQEGEVNFSTAVTDFERQLILEALDRSNWVKNRAAKMLNMKRTTLVEKMKRINLEKERLR
ncbi:MAG: sigma-54-dependent Fis family transcriptional regulator [Deltaproteobacteria bacterium]|nr:sigma-54-dependent Fis family transcriptional regulator [Deltaproteobacteria bacterium]